MKSHCHIVEHKKNSKLSGPIKRKKKWNKEAKQQQIMQFLLHFKEQILMETGRENEISTYSCGKKGQSQYPIA